MAGKIKLKIGNSVIVKPSVLDPDLGTDISGWQGRISQINPENNSICIDWDSITLKNIPSEVIFKCEEEGLDWSQIYLEPTDVELTQAKDTEKDVAAIIEEIEAKHRWSHLGEEGKRIQAVLVDVEPDDEIAAFETWSEHLKKVLSFPFKAKVAEFQETGQLRNDDQVTLEGITSVEDLYGILVKVKHERRGYDFPLCDLEATDSKSPNYGFLRDYVVWFANR
ncbi:calcium-binding protein [Nostoc sp.]